MVQASAHGVGHQEGARRLRAPALRAARPMAHPGILLITSQRNRFRPPSASSPSLNVSVVTFTHWSYAVDLCSNLQAYIPDALRLHFTSVS